MIRGVHAMLYSPKADELRAFLRDKLDMEHTDVGDGWLIFKPESSEIGCHPADTTSHQMSLWCDDIETTVAELKAKGVEFTCPIADQGFGLITRFRLPDGTELELYQPKYTT